MIRFLRDESQAKKTVYRLGSMSRTASTGPRSLLSRQKDTAEFKRLQVAMAGEGSLSGQTTFRDVQVASHPDDPYILFTPDGWVEPAFIHLAQQQ